MLLERIDVHAGSSLDAIQLGPFSHGLNTVYGPPGSGKSATIEFLRSVMLGTDRHFHGGVSGSILWADRDGMIDCRRDEDGTPGGRLAVEFVARDGVPRDYYRSRPDVVDGDSLGRLVQLPRPIINAIISPTSRTSLKSMLVACRNADLDSKRTVVDQPETARVRARLAELDEHLKDYAHRTGGRRQLENRRQELVDYLGHLDRLERTPPESDARRQSLELRASDARDEITRLRLQEKELRQSLSEIERQLSNLTTTPAGGEGKLRIAAARRLQLEELDSQLIRLCQTCRDIRQLRSSSQLRDPSLPTSYSEVPVRFYAVPRTGDRWQDPRSRIESVRQRLEQVLRFYDPQHDGRAYGRGHDDAAFHRPAYLARAEADSVVQSLRALVAYLNHFDADRDPLHGDNDTLRDCDSALVLAISRLVEARGVLLRQVAREHHLPLDRLIDAFGDWRQCQDAPHLYEWLLSDQIASYARDGHTTSRQCAALESEQRGLLDELSRSANRLDNLTAELRVLDSRLQALPYSLPIAVDHRRRVEAREELANIERQLRWLDSGQTLDDERRQLRGRLESLVRGSRRSSPLLSRASYWLDQLSGGYLRRMVATSDGSIRLDGRSAPGLAEAQRQTAALALRMAAADALLERGVLIPLLVDEPSSKWLGADAVRRLANVFAKFTDARQQLVVFTSDRGLADSIRYVGGQLHAISPSRYYHLRYREEHAAAPIAAPTGDINRELDTAWREANGVYDDPHWYRTRRSSTRCQPRTVADREYRPAVAEEPAVYSHPAHDLERDLATRVVPGPASPFFLTESSAVDSAPSIDAVAAGRLQTLGIRTVGDLLAADSRILADRLELADVTAGVVQRWQHESRLVCGVPQLRNFDARVLVGCGFTDPHQLARMHPGRLLERVEAFLATERGRQILRSGTSYELSRITSWIAAANRSVARSSRHGRSSERRNDRSRRSERDHQSGQGDSGGLDPAAGAGKRPEPRKSSVTRPASLGSSEPKFFLQGHSPLVDAPSIGPKTASKLQAAGYDTVQAFLAADPATIEASLGNGRIAKAKIRKWQQQAVLNCRVPMLRGHDVQLLVEAGITRADRLARCDAEWLLSKIDAIARSQQGKRILRGAKCPDLAEISQWIHWAKESRSLRAA